MFCVFMCVQSYLIVMLCVSICVQSYLNMLKKLANICELIVFGTFPSQTNFEFRLYKFERWTY